MKADLRSFYLVLILAAVLTLAASDARAGSRKKPIGPRLQIQETTFHAGSIPAGGVVTHDFIVNNVGDEELHILKVKPGCGCTVVQFSQVIPPGKSGRVTMKVYYSDDWGGKLIRQASVMETNDPKAKRVSLAIKANITPRR